MNGEATDHAAAAPAMVQANLPPTFRRARYTANGTSTTHSVYPIFVGAMTQRTDHAMFSPTMSADTNAGRRCHCANAPTNAHDNAA